MNKIVLLFVLGSIIFPLTDILGQAGFFMSSDKNSVMIGEPFEVTTKFTLQNSRSYKTIDFSPIRRSINTLFVKDSILFEPTVDIELLSSSQWKKFSLKEPYPLDALPFLQNGNTLTYENTFTFAIYNPGIFILNLPKLDNESWTDSTTINIEVTVPDSLSVLAKDTLYPIKPIIIEPSHWTDYLVYLYILLGIALVYFAIKYVKNNPSKSIEKLQAEVIKLPHEIAFEKLELLEKSENTETIHAKDFQSQLTFIFREYIENQFNIKALEMSTSECLGALSLEEGISNDLLNDAGNILNMADLVKFAKAETVHDTHAQYLDKVRRFILATMSSK